MQIVSLKSQAFWNLFKSPGDLRLKTSKSAPLRIKELLNILFQIRYKDEVIKWYYDIFFLKSFYLLYL